MFRMDLNTAEMINGLGMVKGKQLKKLLKKIDPHGYNFSTKDRDCLKWPSPDMKPERYPAKIQRKKDMQREKHLIEDLEKVFKRLEAITKRVRKILEGRK